MRRTGVAVLAFALVGCTSVAAAPAKPTPPAPLKVGAVHTLSDGATVQVVSVQRNATVGAGNPYRKPPAGSQWVEVSARVCVVAPATMSMTPWTMVTADGAQYPATYIGASEITGAVYPEFPTPFNAGECAAGVLAFDVPATATTVRYALLGPPVEVVTWR